MLVTSVFKAAVASLLWQVSRLGPKWRQIEGERKVMRRETAAQERYRQMRAQRLAREAKERRRRD